MGTASNGVMELTGSVVAADMEGMSFVLRDDRGRRVSMPIASRFEEIVVRALALRLALRLRVRFEGERDGAGNVKNVSRVVSVDVADEPDTGPRKSILEIIEDLSAKVPDESWAKLPKDGARNLDHYVYGAPKVDD